MKILKSIGYILFFKIIYRVKVIGKENIDKNKFYVVAANHKSVIDPILIWCMFDNIQTMAKAELFKNPLKGWLYRKLGAFPIKRGQKDFGSLYHAINILKKQESNLAIFPEGTRNKGNIEITPKIGAVYISLASGAEILPIHVLQKPKIFSKTTIIIGKPYSLVNYKENIKDKKFLNEKSKELMKTIYGLDKEKEV